MNRLAVNPTPNSINGTNRTNTIENVRKNREERKNHLTMTGEIALNGNRDSTSLTRNIPPGHSRGLSNGSCDLRMINHSRISSSGTENIIVSHDYSFTAGVTKPIVTDMNKNNGVMRNPLRPKQEQEIDQATKILNEDLLTIDKNLNQKANIIRSLNVDENGSYLNKMSKGPATRKVPIAKANVNDDLNKKTISYEEEMNNSNIGLRLQRNHANQDKNPISLSLNSNGVLNSANKKSNYGSLDLTNNYSNNWNNTININKSFSIKENYGNDYSKTIDFLNAKEPTDTKIFTKPNLKKIKEQPQPQIQSQPQEILEDKRKVQDQKTKINSKSSNVIPTNVVKEEETQELIVCPEGCGRKFKPKALMKHAAVCKKVFGTKRSQFDTKEIRATDDNPIKSKLIKEKGENKKPSAKNLMNETKGKWKLESEQLRAQIKAAKSKK